MRLFPLRLLHRRGNVDDIDVSKDWRKAPDPRPRKAEAPSLQPAWTDRCYFRRQRHRTTADDPLLLLQPRSRWRSSVERKRKRRERIVVSRSDQ